MSNIIDSIQLSGTVYTLSAQTGGGGVPESAFTAYTAATDERISQDEEVTAAALNVLNESLSGKQDTLSAGTNITISGNVISAEGGGKAIEAGRGISVTTGETADTVSFNLPISAGTGTNSIIECSNTSANGNNSHAEGRFTEANGIASHAEGYWSTAATNYSHAEGNGTVASGYYSHTEGNNTVANNQSEHASGQYNVSNSATTTFGNSGNTLFSVGNGDWRGRHNAFEIRQNGDIYLTSGGTDIKLQDHLGGGGSVTVDTELDSGSTNPVQNKVIYNKIDEVEEVTAAGLNALNDKITPTVELTQAEYDALTTKDPNTYYIITDAQAGDLTQYWTSAQTQSAITQAVSGKQDTLSAGTNITISGNVISAEGGGKAIKAGRGISVTTGATADTVSLGLPISAGTDSNSIREGNSTKANGEAAHAEGYSTTANTYAHAEGNNTKASGTCSHAEGSYTVANGVASHAEGLRTIANNQSEHASGQYNVSNKANSTWGDSGNTLFSVGNGTSTSARHNAFEIRQNGDIYLTKDGQDVKLQDQLGGSSITVDTALDSGSTNPVENRVIYNKIDEVEQVTAAGLNAVNDALGGLKLVSLSQAEYNALATKDSSTLYIIVN